MTIECFLRNLETKERLLKSEGGWGIFWKMKTTEWLLGETNDERWSFQRERERMNDFWKGSKRTENLLRKTKMIEQLFGKVENDWITLWKMSTTVEWFLGKDEENWGVIRKSRGQKKDFQEKTNTIEGLLEKPRTIERTMKNTGDDRTILEPDEDWMNFVKNRRRTNDFKEIKRLSRGLLEATKKNDEFLQIKMMNEWILENTEDDWTIFRKSDHYWSDCAKRRRRLNDF